MRILITGGTGLIGQQLIIALLKREHDIVLLTRDKEAAKFKFVSPSPRLETIVDDLDALDFNRLDAVINLAGEPIVNKRWTAKQKERLCSSRWLLTKNLASRIKAAKIPPRIFLSGSAIGIYGRQSEAQVTEDFQDFNNEFSHTLCFEWEALASQAASEHTRVCLLRTGIVLAENGGALNKMLPAFRFGLGGPIASGKQIMSWIHIQDMVNAILFLLDHSNISGPVNMTAPHAVSNQAFSETLAKVLHRPCLFRVPEAVLKLVMGEMSDLLIYGQHVIPEKLNEAGFQFRYPDLDQALKALLVNS